METILKQAVLRSSAPLYIKGLLLKERIRCPPKGSEFFPLKSASNDLIKVISTLGGLLECIQFSLRTCVTCVMGASSVGYS